MVALVAQICGEFGKLFGLEVGAGLCFLAFPAASGGLIKC